MTGVAPREPESDAAPPHVCSAKESRPERSVRTRPSHARRREQRGRREAGPRLVGRAVSAALACTVAAPGPQGRASPSGAPPRARFRAADQAKSTPHVPLAMHGRLCVPR